MSLDKKDVQLLGRAVELAREALDAGDEPFGSVLASPNGTILFEGRNRVKDGDHTQHPEFEIARWSAQNLSEQERKEATVYTSGEHCPMCAAAHGWVGLGRIVYATSSEQLSSWQKEWNLPAGPVNPLPINAVVPTAQVEGPVPSFVDEVRELQRLASARQNQ